MSILNSNFITEIIDKDLENGLYEKIITRFPPEPNGLLHVGHAKAILLNYEIAKKYNGQFNLRIDDTNPMTEKADYIEHIVENVKWLGVEFDNTIRYASDYFEEMYMNAEELILKGLAYVCDLTEEEIKKMRGTLTAPGSNSPFRNRSVEENLYLFRKMKEGVYLEGQKVLRAKINMDSKNMNLRDPIIYRIIHKEHYRTKDKWCIYPMYDFAHPIEDAIEGVTHSICTLEFGNHRPLYNWVINSLHYENKPRQIEFSKLQIENVVVGKRQIKELIDRGMVSDWGDPRLVTLDGLKNRGYSPEMIRRFIERCGVSKSATKISIKTLELCVRECIDESLKYTAILNPIHLEIDNISENELKYINVHTDLNNSETYEREIIFSKHLYIEAEDFCIDPLPKYRRLFIGNDVRLMNAYVIHCSGFEVKKNGEITVHAWYYPNTLGRELDEKKVKGVIHWLSSEQCQKAVFRCFDNFIDNKSIVRDSDGAITAKNETLMLYQGYVDSFVEIKNNTPIHFYRKGFFYKTQEKEGDNKCVTFVKIADIKSSSSAEC